MTLLERQVWAALISVPGIGQRSFRWLQTTVQRKGYSLVDFWHHWPSLQLELGLKLKHQGGLRSFQRRFSLEGYWEYLCQRQISVVTDQDSTYPLLLAQCEDRPPLLFVKGSSQFWNHTPIAVVGTRKITSYGQFVTAKITAELVTGGEATIISGFMYGVDALAHQTALTHGGRTVGVLGYGFDHIYPRHHRSLEAQVLAQGGCLVTELAPMVSPTPGTFPARNRIIAGLSQAVVVTEAAEQSGSHITASYALDYGRVVAAVPGPITNYFSQGTKNLLKQGAVMISSGYELLDELGVQSTSPKLVNGSQLADEVSIALLEAVGLQPGTIDELAHRLQFSLPQITVALTMLELTQQLKKVGDTWYLTSSQ